MTGFGSDDIDLYGHDATASAYSTRFSSAFM
ncbi:hypothetical protein FG05_35084 [Fusarium graminearum]|nr:hypothetical protein FG05_35084 [Fusarium graminearum]